jgi:TRAP-type transport system periplasmic protein
MARLLIVVVLACCAALAPTQTAAQTVLRVATIAPDGSVWMREMRAGADEIARRTDGRVSMQGPGPANRVLERGRTRF